MRHRDLNHKYTEDLNIWQAFTDLMSNAFMILSLFLLLVITQSVFSQSTAGQVIKRLKSPPLIVIKDSDNDDFGRPIKFETGRAELPEGLQSFIDTKVVPQLEDFARQYPGYIVDVIGHTDGQETVGAGGNIDKLLEEVANGRQPISNLRPGSNADLGLMRALAVVKRLQETQATNRLPKLKFRAYSAAQLFLPSGEYARTNRAPDETRRRIEIRFTPPAVEK